MLSLKENKSQDEAFAAAKADKKKSRKDIECFNCKKKGHYKSECWVKGGGDEGGGPKKSKAKDGRDTVNTAGMDSFSKDKARAVIIEANNAPSRGEPYIMQSALTASTASTRSEAELYDSGASRHMSPFQHRFTNLCSIPPCPIIAANNHTFFATGMGNLKINVPNGSSFTCITLKDAFYAPGMTLTVVSIHKIARAGYKVSLEDDGCKIKNKEGKTIGKIPASPNGLYKVDHPITAAAVQEQLDFLTVHQRLGHISANAICFLIRTNAVTGLQSTNLSSSFTCNLCEYAKATHKVI